MNVMHHEKGKDAFYKIWNASDENMIIYFCSDGGSLVFGDTIYPIKEGGLCFVTAGVLHYTMPSDPSIYDRCKIFLSPERTRALYAAGDKEALRALAEGDYAEFLSRLERFYAAFRKQWYTVNKTYGFEIQDIRLGGLMQRTKSCRERLLEYARGDISEIAELAEEALPYPDGNVPYKRTASACVF